jgi:hypothetical protein
MKCDKTFKQGLKTQGEHGATMLGYYVAPNIEVNDISPPKVVLVHFSIIPPKKKRNQVIKCTNASTTII